MKKKPKLKAARKMPIIISSAPRSIIATIACSYRPRVGHVIEVNSRAFVITRTKRVGQCAFKIMAEADV